MGGGVMLSANPIERQIVIRCSTPEDERFIVANSLIPSISRRMPSEDGERTLVGETTWKVYVDPTMQEAWATGDTSYHAQKIVAATLKDAIERYGDRMESVRISSGSIRIVATPSGTKIPFA
jgi:hypothetical protein